MLLTIPAVLDAGQLAEAATLLDQAPFRDGRQSVGATARRVKNNQELDPRALEVKALNALVLGSLYRNPRFRGAALPYRISGAFFARYTAGMAYGEHIDDPVMGEEGQRYRCDIAITVFLSGPDAYDGGELMIRTPFGTQEVKLPAGDAVVYPASSRHRVAEVTRGERLVAVAWAQSLVRDPARREILYDLDAARQALQEVTPDAEVTAAVNNAYANLVRMWAEV